MKKFLILTVWMVLGNIIYSQTYYNKEYKEINEINQIIPAHDGGFILAGSSNGNAALVKQWNRFYFYDHIKWRHYGFASL